MKTPRSTHGSPGLTLIELVLSLTILALAGALVAGAFATALRAWESGSSSGREELVARIVLERIAGQLRSALETFAERDREDVVAFDAGEDHLRFVTLAAGPVPAQVFYGLTGDGHLVYREYPWPDKEFFAEKRPRTEEEVAEIAGLAVRVLARDVDADGEARTSTERWSQPTHLLPAEVTVEIAVPAAGETEPRRYAITVPIPTGAWE